MKKTLEEVTFCDLRQNQVFQVLKGVQQLRWSGQFTDLMVKVQEQEYKCHHFLLAANLPFLRTMIEDYKQPLRVDMEQERKKLNDGSDSNAVEMNDNNNINSSHMCPSNSGTAISSSATYKDLIVLRGIQLKCFKDSGLHVLCIWWCYQWGQCSGYPPGRRYIPADIPQKCASFITEALSVKKSFWHHQTVIPATPTNLSQKWCPVCKECSPCPLTVNICVEAPYTINQV